MKDHSLGLLRTIDSVCSQTFRDYEYIVVDGASTDGTLDIIESNKSIFSKILYGPDKGIYDAMNKGIDAAEGGYILFMNAGDVFADEKSLEMLMSTAEKSDVLYGDYTVDYGFLKRYVAGAPLKEIWKGMLTSHQAVAVRTELAKRFRFDLKYRLGADFDMIYRIYKNGGSFSYVPYGVALVESGGLSDIKRLTVYRNHLDTLKAQGMTFRQHAYYMFMFIDSWLRLTLKKVLPLKIVKRIIAMKADR